MLFEDAVLHAHHVHHYPVRSIRPCVTATSLRQTNNPMASDKYPKHKALNPFFDVVMKGLKGSVDGEHYYDAIAEDPQFEFLHRFPGWTVSVRATHLSEEWNLCWSVGMNGDPLIREWYIGHYRFADSREGRRS
jgi:hypothetical protein